MQNSLKTEKFARFADLTFEKFRKMAQDPGLSSYEKIGFPDEYRRGFEPWIFEDIRRKLTALDAKKRNIVDIGPGCAEIPLMLASLCERRNHQLTWIDSPEMLAHLPDAPFIHKTAAQFPAMCPQLIETQSSSFDAVLAYSILHYIMPGSDIFAFLDAALALLAPGGTFLLGDIPNISKRKRFFASETGRLFHRKVMATQNDPAVAFNIPEPNKIDDAVIFSVLMRARASGFHAYVVPQDDRLPMANRREDILIRRP
jgi:Methyltransferase domain